MLVTALRDGMNLVAKEYVASRYDDDGVLVLSEFTGASDELRQAVLVNPHDIDGLKDAMVEAARMPKRERARRMRALRKRVRDNDVANWSATFLETLTGAGPIAPGVPDGLRAAIARLSELPRLLVALDFDGTLAPIVDRPDDARSTDRARAAVERLAGADDTRVALVSGRALDSLKDVAAPPVAALLSGSHGVELQLDSGGVTLDLREGELTRLGQLIEIVEDAASAADGAWVERKPAGIALHTRKLSATAGAALQRVARERVDAELPGLSTRSGKNVLEFAVRASDKGEALTRLRQHAGVDAVLYVGDDVTDEDAFATLESDDVGVKVGQGKSLAAFRLRGPDDVAELLELLADRRDASR
jgi:trehalose 6-phosphate synthase/phosphatase